LADSGTAIYLEKPIARSLIELDALIALYEGSRVTCGFQRRSFANVGVLRALLAELPVGPVRRIELHEGGRTLATGASSEFRDDPQAAGGGILTDLGCHGLDTIDQLVNLDAAVVQDQELVVDEGVERDATIHLRTADIDVVLELSWLRDIDSCVRVICEHGVITSSARMLGGVRVETPGAPVRSLFGRDAQNPTQGFWDVWCHALQLPGSDVDYSLPTSRAVVRITEEIYRAAGLR
jgi:predicted dehydrogenase